MIIYEYTLKYLKIIFCSKIKKIFKNLNVWNIVLGIALEVSPKCAFRLNNILTRMTTISF